MSSGGVSSVEAEEYNVVHNKISLHASVVFHGIDRDVRNIISTRRSRKGFSSLMTMWLR
ncbi:hypothetical protein F2Q70_00008919 [Brassica cretica]|uniref:Uncharacterized protein n=1 Tax=Brassica cretica TaxID=69181 RepID=A0A8S9M6C4_BRACR|nr:hypothetical protein F2Q70_00008919 [Brassica cretica]